MPEPGTLFSASTGSSLEEGAAGVPHGMIRWTMAGKIRAKGGQVTHAPERSATSGTIDRQHMHVVECGDDSDFAPAEPNPVPKRRRFGGPEYVEPALPL